ncbi:MAG: purine-binding chemotaxis protein CheW [Oscillospiraceae bacterium]|nr:purine-binding chemotaxis protein CheW [Oscillospiraceae bacterium]
MTHLNTAKVDAFLTEEDNLLKESAQTGGVARKYLIFITDNLKLGVDAEYVVEILNNHYAAYLPMTPDYIRGIFNMRGQIIPVLDIRLRLGKPANDEDTLLVVLNFDNTQVGILVDAVDQMIEIPTENILPMPSQSTQRLVSGMCTIPDGTGTMLVLDCEQLLSYD